jgi:hypothetical protein
LGDLHEFPIHPLELWGQICFQLAAQPKDMLKDIHRGTISIEVCFLPVVNYKFYDLISKISIYKFEFNKRPEN